MTRFYAWSVPDWTPIDGDLPLNDVSITRALSTPKSLDATLKRGNLAVDDRISEWATVIAADHRNRLDVFVVDGVAPDDPEQSTLAITAGGLASYAKDQPWLIANNTVRDALSGTPGWVRSTDSISGVEVDPLDMVRAIWRMLLSAPRADLRLSIDSTTSPVRIGEEEEDVEFTTGAGDDVAFTAGPYKLTWHDDHDMGGEIDSLAEETPFEWVEESSWAGELPDTLIRIGHPGLPAPKKPHLFFEIGTNITSVGPVTWREHADVVLVVGEGEGSSRVRSHMSDATTKLRRVHVEADRGISSRSRAIERARKMLDHYKIRPILSEVTVMDHKAARFGSFDIGDIITVRGFYGDVDVTDDYRIVSLTHDLTADSQTLTLEVDDA